MGKVIVSSPSSKNISPHCSTPELVFNPLGILMTSFPVVPAKMKWWSVISETFDTSLSLFLNYFERLFLSSNINQYFWYFDMKSNKNLISVFILIFILIFVGNYLFKRGNSDHYKNYNRVIDEPDSISVIEDQFW